MSVCAAHMETFNRHDPLPPPSSQLTLAPIRRGRGRAGILEEEEHVISAHRQHIDDVMELIKLEMRELAPGGRRR